MENELIEPQQTEMIERADAGVQLGSLNVADPGQVVVMAQKIAAPLAQMIEERRLFAVISNRKHVYVEGWATCGAMLGVVPRLLEEHEDPNNPGEFVATVEAVRTSDGVILGRAKASCGPDESTWKSRSRQARRSMAQTRATGKVFRLLFSWVMQLAGYETTPFEEMDGGVVPTAEPNPERNREAPQTPTRSQRQGPPVTWEQVDVVYGRYADGHMDLSEEELATKFPEWVQRVCAREFKVWAKTKGTNAMAFWTQDDLAKCNAAMEGGK